MSLFLKEVVYPNQVAFQPINTPVGPKTGTMWYDSTLNNFYGVINGTIQLIGSGGGIVTSVFGRTGDVTAQNNDYNFSQIAGTVAGFQLPNPGPSSLGGVESYASVAHQFVNQISTNGVVSSAQPSFTDLTGSITSTQLGNVAFPGPDPWIDVRSYGARSVVPTATTCTSTATSPVVTLGAASTFINGEGITCIGAGTALALSTPSAPTVVASDTTYLIGTGHTTPNPGSLASASYSIRAMTTDGQITPASITTSIANQQILGQQSVPVASWTRSGGTTTVNTPVFTLASVANASGGNTVYTGTITRIPAVGENYVVTAGFTNGANNGTFTVVAANSTTLTLNNPSGVAETSAATATMTHTLVVGSYVMFTGDSELEGSWIVATTPTNTSFTFVQAKSTLNGDSAGNPASGGFAYYWHCNHITWTHVTNAFRYLIYRDSTLIGVSYPDYPVVNTVALYNSFDDFGSAMTVAPSVPAWWPTVPNTTGQNGNLTTTIVSGAGTTTVTLAVNAGSSNGSAPFNQFVHDDAGPIRAAALVAQANKQSLYLPVSGVTVNSVLKLGDTGTITILQSGGITLNDTVYFPPASFNGINWTGFPLGSTSAPAIGLQALPNIAVNTAYPGFYVQNVSGLSRFSHLNIAVNSNAGVGMVYDGGSIPSAQFNHLNFGSSGSTNYMARHQVFRNPIGGGSGFYWSYVTFAGGVGQGSCPSNCNLINPSPVFMFESLNGQIMTMDHIEALSGTLSFAVGNILNLDINMLDSNGANMAMLNFGNFGAGGIKMNVDVRGLLIDSTQRPMINYIGAFTGYIGYRSAQGQSSGFPTVAGPGGLAIVSQGPYDNNYTGPGQTIAADSGLITFPGVDGIQSLGSGATNVSAKFLNASLATGPAYTNFIRNLPAAAPTCTVSAGGSVAIGSYTFSIEPVFPPNNANGVVSPSSTVCTTSTGNQTITINWTAVPGATVGYNINVGGNRFNASYPTVNGTTTSLVWSSGALTGPTPFKLPGGGPTSIALQAVTSPSFVLPGANGGGILTLTAPTITAPRAVSFQDAAGTVPLLGTAQTWTATQTFGNSLTGSQTTASVSITPTWNTTGVVDAALLINPTNTASGAGSLLIDAQLGGTSQYKVDKAGNVTMLGSLSSGAAPPNCTPGTAGGSCIAEGTAPTAGASYDTLYGNSADHMIHQNLNNGGDIPVPNRVMNTSTYTNATTTASNITGLNFAVAASSSYTMRCDLYYQGSASTAGLDITITGPASPTSVFYSYDEDATATSLQDSVASSFGTKLTGNTTVTSTTNFHATVTMGLRNGSNAGTVQVQGSATGAGTVTVQPGSFCLIS